jgi:hypothetical protein
MSETLTYPEILNQITAWANKRTAAQFWTPCSNKYEARDLQTFLKQHNFKGFVTHFGTTISVVLYLSDNPKPLQ